MIDEIMLDALREKLKGVIFEKRYIHTLEVEKMALRLGRLFVDDDKLPLLSAAALLHDITKALPFAEQSALAIKLGIEIDNIDINVPKSYHAKTAAALIPIQYPEFNLPVITEAVRWHTTGKADMSIYEKIIYFADYIDMSRTFDDCVMLRERFWSACPENMEKAERCEHFRKLLVLSFDITIKGLLDEGLPICRDTFEARNYLICNKNKKNGRIIK